MVNVENIPQADYRKLLSQYSFDRYPRSFGNPKQIFVHDWNQLYQNIILNNGKRTCFISHNAWGDIGDVNGKELPTKIWYDTLFFDFDDSRKPENAQLDAIHLVEWLEERKLPYIIQFSGSKGFHVFLQFIPRLFDYRKYDETEREMSLFIRRVFRWFKNTLNLRTLDDTVGEPKKLCRLPYTRHVNSREGVVHDEQCVPLTKHMLLNWDITRIRDYSIDPPRVIIPHIYPVTLDVVNFVMKYDVRLSDEDILSVTAPQVEQKSHGHIMNKELKLYMDHMAKYKPCIVSNLQTMNPDHFTRVAFALYMKRMGVSKRKFRELYERLAIENSYIDFYIGTETREYQIDHIYDNPNYRYEPSCTTIKQNHPHLCLREKCHRYISNYKKRKKPQPAKLGRIRR